MSGGDAGAAWDAALERYRGVDLAPARVNVALLEGLRARWEQTVRPDTSLLTLRFSPVGANGTGSREQVEVLAAEDDLVCMALLRREAGNGDGRAAAPVVVAGDYTPPEDALPAVEALLRRLAARSG